MLDNTPVINGTVGAIGRRNRTRIEIMALILAITREGITKTQLMYLGNLSHNLLQKYLGFATRAGLVEVRQGENRPTYKTTQKGLQFLVEYEDSKKYSSLLERKKRELDGLLR